MPQVDISRKAVIVRSIGVWSGSLGADLGIHLQVLIHGGAAACTLAHAGHVNSLVSRWLYIKVKHAFRLVACSCRPCSVHFDTPVGTADILVILLFIFIIK